MRLVRLSPIVAVLVLAACGGGGGTTTVTVTVTETATETVQAPARIAGRVYFLRDGAVAPVARSLPGTSEQDLLSALRAGPTAPERAAGLSSAADPTSPEGLAQIVYTLSQFDPDGRVTYAGKTYTRADFEDQTPTILVESPLPFQIVRSPLHATGTANTFEATVEYELRDANGKVVKKGFTTATSGSGVRGTFDFTVPFAIDPGGSGTFTVYESSAKDGSRIHVVEIPVRLEP